jgi:hypothetical protein
MSLINGKDLYKVKRTIIIKFKKDIMNIIEIIKIIDPKVIVIKIKVIRIPGK